MTRTFKDSIHCPHCGRLHTVETALERWIRGQETMDSRRAGIVRFDLDILLHRYLIATDKKSSRDIQCLMFIEAKTFGAGLTLAQQDTLSLFNQVLRNRRRNIHREKQGRHATNHVPLANAFSYVKRKNVRLKLFGGHLLQMSGVDPETSKWLLWDCKPITMPILLGLLRFDIDPDSLRPIDWRRRYSSFPRQPSLLEGIDALNDFSDLDRFGIHYDPMNIQASHD